MVDVFIGIGGNLGDREDNINKAVSALSDHFNNVTCSQMYKTEPRDYYDQDYFINVVVKGVTDLTPLEILELTQSIEKGGGRTRNKKKPKGPRTIDLDILLFGNEVVNKNDLKIPHPSMKERKFVLIPLLELDHEIFDPQTGIPYYKYLEKVEKQGVYCSSLNDYNNLFL